MKIRWKWRGWLALAALFIGMMTLADAALAYTVSGTIQNLTGKSTNTSTGQNRVYIVLMQANSNSTTGLGTSISVTSGGSQAFSIHGVPPGTYDLGVFMDVDNTSTLHINDPAIGTQSSFSVTSGNVNVGTLPLSAPSLTGPSAPSQNKMGAVATSNGALVQWKGPTSPYGGNGPDAELADSYTLYWGTSPNPTNLAQSKTVSATGGDYHVFVSGLSGSLYFGVKAVNGAGSAYAGTTSATTIAASSGTPTVSGRVFSGGLPIAKPSTAPLYIVLIPDNKNAAPYIALIPAPVPDTATWTINGVQAGTYSVYAILDLNNDGFSSVAGYATGRGMKTGASPTVTVGATGATAPDITVTAPNSNTVVTTGNQSNGSYSLQFRSDSAVKRPVSVTINSGPNLTESIDLGLSLGNGNSGSFGDSGSQANFNTKPSVGDTYSVAVSYSDGTSETLSPKVTGVVTSAPTLIFPNGNTSPINTNTTPFAWTTPQPLPAGYYDFYLSMNSGFNYNQFWAPQNNSNNNMPSTQLSILYNSDGNAQQSQLTSGTYSWQLTVSDAYGNQMWGNGMGISPQSGGPIISSFNPATGPAGTSVTINGSGFSGATNVSFGGVTATVNSNNGSQITATVPANAAVGPITVTDVNGVVGASSTMFTPTVSFSGNLQTSAKVNIANATVSVENSNPAISTITDSSGNFTLNVPSGVPYVLRFHGGSGHDTLSAVMSNTSNSSAPASFHLYTDSDLSSVGITNVNTTPATGMGLIYGSVRDWDNASTKYQGATLTATSFLHPNTPYTVTYTSGTSTQSDGKFYVQNVNEGDIVAVTATLAGYKTQPRTYMTHMGVISEAGVNATPLPTFTVSPASGSTMTTAQQVTLTVNNAVGGDSYNIVYTTDGSDPTTSVTRTVVVGATSTSFALPAGNPTVVKYFAINNAHGDASAVATASYTVNFVPSTYNLTVTISGNGTVNSVSGPTVSCSGSGCTPTAYTAGGSFVLAATPSNSLFNGWSGTGSASSCSGTGNCSFTLNADTTVTATFIAYPPVEISGGTPTYYNSLATAYGTLGASSSATMLTQGVTLTGDCNLNNTVTLILHGGYNSIFGAQTGPMTTLQGVLTVGQGSLTVDDVVISP